MLLQPTATILDRLQVNQLVAAKQQPMVEAGPGQAAEVSGARDDRKLFVGMLSKGQVRVIIIKMVMMVMMMVMMVQVEEDVRQLLASVLGLGGGGVEEVTIYTISTQYLHYIYTISTLYLHYIYTRAGWAEDLPSLGTGRAGHGCSSFITGQGDTVSRHV